MFSKKCCLVFNKRGQSLIEVLIAVTLGALMIVAAFALIVPILQNSARANREQVASALAKELLDNVKSLSEGDWHSINSLNKLDHYYLDASSSPFVVNLGEEVLTVSSTDYSRYFYLDDVNRSGGIIDVNGSENDPSAAKITVVYSWPFSATKTLSQYLFRYNNNVFVQSDWSRGPGEIGPLTFVNSRFTTSSFIDYTSSTGSLFVLFGNSGPGEGVFGPTNIDPVNRWAWNDAIGWIDFYETNTVLVSSQEINGYASSSIGDISLNCASTRNGNICGQSNYKVLNNGGGDLSGWGWNDLIGWISFCGTTNPADSNTNCPLTSFPYRVYIDGNNGDFHNFAWSDSVGWISFNCADYACSQSYKLNTAWRPISSTGTLDSFVFDTGVASGTQINSIMWQGDLPVDEGIGVDFKIASSNCPNGADNPPVCDQGTWVFMGPGGSSESSYPLTPGQSLGIDYNLHNNKRYFRYRLIMSSNKQQTVSPRVDDIIINWSP